MHGRYSGVETLDADLASKIFPASEWPQNKTKGEETSPNKTWKYARVEYWDLKICSGSNFGTPEQISTQILAVPIKQGTLWQRLSHVFLSVYVYVCESICVCECVWVCVCECECVCEWIWVILAIDTERP